MSQEIQDAILILVPLLLQLAGLTFAVLMDSYLKKRHRKILLLIIAAVFSLILQNVIGYYLDMIVIAPYERTVTGIYGYCVRPLIIVLFLYVVSERKSFPFAWALIGVNTLVYLTAFFSRIAFWIDEANDFHRGPLGYTCHIISGVLLANLVFYVIREYGRVRRSEVWIPVFNALCITVSVIADSKVDYHHLPVNFLTVAVVSGSVFFYIWLHLQFVREHERALMAEQRIRIMMSQIQPHFLYNTLSTIQALIRTDPDRAFEVTEKFGTYLRQNIDSLVQTEMIPIAEELEHTRVYAEIEMIRFPNIHVAYETEDDAFSLPALTVQPLVENAIRHGVRIRPDGRVTVSTKRTEQAHEIVIRDNGKGFDVSEIENADEGHIGVRNVRERIETMCGGSFSIESVVGEGTTVTIRIPVQS